MLQLAQPLSYPWLILWTTGMRIPDPPPPGRQEAGAVISQLPLTSRVIVVIEEVFDSLTLVYEPRI